MHLHQLKIKNLASLRGEHTVEFDSLAGQDLFAITGETGSGKSTLLNALSLALFGRLYKRQLIQSDLVTLGEREASISLHFSVKGEHYLSSWSTVVRKKDGSPLTNPRTERFFYQLPPTLDFQEARVLEKSPEELLQLDFEQFCKCVVLNQGEFARFLTASFSERRDILERLYPSDNIDSVGGLARRKFDEKKVQANNLDIQAHALQEEALFDVEVVKSEEARARAELAKAQEGLARLRPIGSILSNLLNNSRMHESARKLLSQTEAQLQDRTTASNAAMTTWQSHHEKYLQATEAWEQERPLVEKHVQETQELLVWMNDQKNLQQQTLDRQQQQKLLQERLTNLNERYGAVATRATELASKVTLAPIDRAWDQLSLPRGLELMRQDSLLDQTLKQAALALAQTETEGKALKEKQDKLQDALKEELRTLPLAWQSLTTAARSSTLALTQATQTERQLLLKARQKHESFLAATRPALEALKSKVSESAWLSSLFQLRQELVLKHPTGVETCPVCEQSLGEDLWKKLTTTWDQDRSDTHAQQLESQKTELLKTQALVSAAEQQLTDALAALSSLPEVDLTGVEETHIRLIKSEESLRDVRERIEIFRKRWKSEQEKAQALQAQSSTLKKESEDWLQATNGLLQTKLSWQQETLTQLQQDADIYRQSSELKREEANLLAQREQLRLDQEALLPQLQSLGEKLLKLQATTEERRTSLEALYGKASPQDRFRERTEELKTLAQKDQWLHNEYRQKERELGDVRARLAALGDQLRDVELLFTQDCQKLAPLLGQSVSFKIEEAPTLLAPLIQSNESQLTQAEQDLKTHAEKLSEFKTLLEKDRLLREKRTLLKEQQVKLNEEVSRYKRLMDVLGQDDLRTYVLSLVEAALIQQTNSELEKLCGGRYEIQHSVRKGKLAPEFWVIDRWRDGLLRKVTTLSGGETFMVSLAMALALAEMTRGKADIDCFFIDEGFGTLDEDSLDGVLEMLQQVRSRGKQIGLITHVKSLSSRLPLNLHLQKDPRGNSTIGIVWN